TKLPRPMPPVHRPVGGLGLFLDLDLVLRLPCLGLLGLGLVLVGFYLFPFALGDALLAHLLRLCRYSLGAFGHDLPLLFLWQGGDADADPARTEAPSSGAPCSNTALARSTLFLLTPMRSAASAREVPPYVVCWLSPRFIVANSAAAMAPTVASAPPPAALRDAGERGPFGEAKDLMVVGANNDDSPHMSRHEHTNARLRQRRILRPRRSWSPPQWPRSRSLPDRRPGRG